MYIRHRVVGLYFAKSASCFEALSRIPASYRLIIFSMGLNIKWIYVVACVNSNFCLWENETNEECGLVAIRVSHVFIAKYLDVISLHSLSDKLLEVFWIYTALICLSLK